MQCSSWDHWTRRSCWEECGSIQSTSKARFSEHTRRLLNGELYSSTFERFLYLSKSSLNLLILFWWFFQRRFRVDKPPGRRRRAGRLGERGPGPRPPRHQRRRRGAPADSRRRRRGRPGRRAHQLSRREATDAPQGRFPCRPARSHLRRLQYVKRRKTFSRNGWWGSVSQTFFAHGNQTFLVSVALLTFFFFLATKSSFSSPCFKQIAY